MKSKARAECEARLSVHASLMAKPAFSAVGFTGTERQVAQIGNESFQRAAMQREAGPLGAGSSAKD